MPKRELSEGAKQARREYARQWRERNPDKDAEYKARLWERKAAQAAGQREVVKSCD
jgi:hypothetical protein